MNELINKELGGREFDVKLTTNLGVYHSNTGVQLSKKCDDMGLTYHR